MMTKFERLKRCAEDNSISTNNNTGTDVAHLEKQMEQHLISRTALLW